MTADDDEWVAPRAMRRRRSEDGPRGSAAKFLVGIISALIVAAVGWNFATILELLRRMEYLEWYLRWKGIIPP